MASTCGAADAPQPTPGTQHVGPARHIIAVGSGKGGVGKSTVSLNLALALAERGTAVGILDADVYGPNIPLMVGLVRTEWQESWTVWRNPALGGIHLAPVERYGLKLMSTGFIVGEDQPLLWEAGMVRLLARHLLHDVEWGNLDYLVVDLPPGTADVQQALAAEIPFSGAVLVVTPQDVAHLDAKKAVQMYRRLQVPILGGVENMSGFLCPHCAQPIDVFPRVPRSRSIWMMGVEQLGQIPLDPALSLGGDRGRPLLLSQPDSAQAGAFRAVTGRLVERLSKSP
ncbi:MAG TPA: P-loop NTPase [Chloroflexota bacterium]